MINDDESLWNQNFDVTQVHSSSKFIQVQLTILSPSKRLKAQWRESGKIEKIIEEVDKVEFVFLGFSHMGCQFPMYSTTCTALYCMILHCCVICQFSDFLIPQFFVSLRIQEIPLFQTPKTWLTGLNCVPRWHTAVWWWFDTNLNDGCMRHSRVPGWWWSCWLWGTDSKPWDKCHEKRCFIVDFRR